MKYLITLAAFILLTSSAIAERPLKIAWDEHPDPQVTGFRCYAKQPDGKFKMIKSVPATDANGKVTTMRIEDFQDESTVIVLTAFNAVGLESLPSEEVSVPPKPGIPGSPIPPSGLKAELTITFELVPK